jgi:hypothetical protein
MVLRQTILVSQPHRHPRAGSDGGYGGRLYQYCDVTEEMFFTVIVC